MTNKQIYVTNTKKSSIFSLLTIGCAALLWGCEGRSPGSQAMSSADSLSAAAVDTASTYQELGFFGDIKKGQWLEFIGAVQNNIGHARKEQGNLSFSLYQPEDGKLQPIWFERYRDTVTHNAHMKQGYFRNAIQVIQRSLEGTARSIDLKEVSRIPAEAKLSVKAGSSRYVIVLFDVKPDKRDAFIELMAGVAKRSRQATGNLEFNVYHYTEDVKRFVLIEGWQTIADHEAQMKQQYIKQLGADTKDFFTSDPMAARWLLKDISQ